MIRPRLRRASPAGPAAGPGAGPERRSRVIVLNHAAAPRSAPGGTRHVELFGRLSAWDATVISSSHNLMTGEVVSTDSLYQTVRTLRSSGNGARRVASWLSYALTATARGLRLPAPEVVYGSSPHLLTGLAAWSIARTKRRPMVLEIRDVWPRILVEMGRLSTESRLYRALRALELFLYHQADQIVVLAEGTRQYLLDEGIEPGRITVISNGADPEDFVPTGPKEQLRARFGLEGFVVAYTGAHGLANGLELVLDAAQALAAQAPEVRWLLVGDGPEKPGLVAEAGRRGLTSVIFMDPVSKRVMPELLGAVDLGLHCLADVPLFRFGVSPNKLFDYMAAGLPVITNTPGEVAGLVRESGGGLAVDPTGLAAGVEQLSRLRPEERAAMGARGRRFIAERYSRAVLARRLEGLLDAVIGADRASPPAGPSTGR